MFVLLSLLSFAACEICKAQVVYSRVVPYDPRYLIRRPPVRRSAMDTLERMRLPMSRYFPQVDTQVASAPYRPALAPLGAYQLTPDDIYEPRPQWAEGLIQQQSDRDYDNNNGDYVLGEEEEEDDFAAPVYRAAPPPVEFMYPEQMEQRQQVADPNLYDDLMVNYVYGEPVRDLGQAELFEIQRRDRKPAAIPMDKVLEANKNSTGNGTVVVAAAEPISVSSTSAPVQMTAVPPPPEKKEVKSLVLPEPEREEDRPWMHEDEELGQKEVPLFRPRQSSQQTRWSELDEQRLTRAKNSNFKSPIPMIKKMIQSGQPQAAEFDPLTEELNSLRKLRKQ